MNEAAAALCLGAFAQKAEHALLEVREGTTFLRPGYSSRKRWANSSGARGASTLKGPIASRSRQLGSTVWPRMRLYKASSVNFPLPANHACMSLSVVVSVRKDTEQCVVFS